MKISNMLFTAEVTKKVQSLRLKNLISIKDIKTLLIYGMVGLLIILPYIRVYNNPEFVLDKLTLLFYVLLVSLVVVNYWLFFLLSIWILLTSVIFLHIMKTWGVWGLGERISVGLESPSYEMSEYLSNYLGFYDVLIILYIVFCAYIIYKIKDRRPESKLLQVFSGVYVVCFPLLLSANPGRLGGDGYPITAIPLEVVNTYERSQQLNHREKYLDNGVKPLECTENYKTIVIVLGESVNKNRMGVYGYIKETTPFLSSLNGHVLNAISPADTTRYSIPMLFTKASVSNFEEFFSSQSIITDLENCGYDTFWLSNQGDRGKWNTYVAAIAKEAKNTIFLQNEEPSYDENLLPELEKIRNHPGAKKAIFLHLKGSHFSYYSRYPEGFGGNYNKNIEESYDNSILYSDYILSEIFNQLTKDSLLFLYTADHGELVNEEEYGHGHSPGYKDEYEIPMVIWSSNAKRAENISALNQYSAINGAMFYDLVRYLVGIDKEVNMNYDSKVIEVGPKNIVRFEELKRYSD